HFPRDLGGDEPETPEQQAVLVEQRSFVAAGSVGLGTGRLPPLAVAAELVRGTAEPPGQRLGKLLLATSQALRNIINKELDDHINESRHHYQSVLWTVVPSSIVGLVSMTGLMRSFYAWIFDPIRHLELGVNRVACGDFERKIELKSGDE